MDAAVRHRTRRGHFHHQRRGGGARSLLDEGAARSGLQATSRTTSVQIRGRPPKTRSMRSAMLLYASKIISYAQGFTLFAAAGKHHNWTLNFGDIATIWRGGCIIRAKFLNRIKEAFDRNAATGELDARSILQLDPEGNSGKLAARRFDRHSSRCRRSSLRRLARLF